MDRNWRPGKRVAIIGAGPGGVSTAIALARAGYNVRLYEKYPEPRPLGGAVLLSVPVLAILREYGIDIHQFGTKVRTEFRNNKGHVRARLPFNEAVEKAMGIEGWHYGVLRSSAFAKMLSALNGIDPGILVPGQAFKEYEDRDNDILVRFENGKEVAADLLIGADGIHSRVSHQAFGDPGLFHVGLRVWLAWCGNIDELPRDLGAITHGRTVQASYFPMLHDGKSEFEWWVVERSDENVEPPSDPETHIRGLLKDFAYPLNLFPDRTDFARQVFRWEIYNRPSIPHYANRRVACVGDAVHPVSPYAAYGMGMAIEDGYFLARSFRGRDLQEATTLNNSFKAYEADRVEYCNHHVEFARELGNRFHKAPAPIAWLRDFVFDHTKVLHRLITKDYLKDSELMSLRLKELHVA